MGVHPALNTEQCRPKLLLLTLLLSYTDSVQTTLYLLTRQCAALSQPAEQTTLHLLAGQYLSLSQPMVQTILYIVTVSVAWQLLQQMNNMNEMLTRTHIHSHRSASQSPELKSQWSCLLWDSLGKPISYLLQVPVSAQPLPLFLFPSSKPAMSHIQISL